MRELPGAMRQLTVQCEAKQSVSRNVAISRSRSGRLAPAIRLLCSSPAARGSRAAGVQTRSPHLTKPHPPCGGGLRAFALAQILTARLRVCASRKLCHCLTVVLGGQAVPHGSRNAAMHCLTTEYSRQTMARLPVNVRIRHNALWTQPLFGGPIVQSSKTSSFGSAVHTSSFAVSDTRVLLTLSLTS
jgi:hypothetical protein